MNDLKDISNRLEQLKFPADVLNRYRESHRFYHTAIHLVSVIKYISVLNQLDDELFLAAVYHDAIFNPKLQDNEEQSADLFLSHAKNTELKEEQKKNVFKFILETKTHNATSPKSQLLIDADLDIFKRSFGELVAYENLIFKENQFLPYHIYKEKRLETLNALSNKVDVKPLINYVENRKPLLGVFCGSFNPFHKGHYNVLKKSENIFDKVIVAFGKNPDKNERAWPVPQLIQHHQLEEYFGLLTDFVQALGHDVVVIRGLRNSTDFQYEQNQYRYIQELMPAIKIINIFCDKEFEHISSSGIRTLEKYNKHHSYLLD
jgi:pantetheine-phosphate adenylyltransferase